ncbi:serine protease Do [Haloferula luteola]|uniref:Serine protease Do n=1 Tax=Haloferula luteola TaxID=595692 RepID=A0A840V4W7_9BACT|nr:S1C family serine protease [Haloferula luteola]MBB5349838.1 serine protease Do [Haloferula luteola]
MLALRITLLLSLTTLASVAEPLSINQKRVPESRDDLKQIQRLMQSALPAARAATVCIQLGQGSGSGVVVSEDGLIMTAAHVTGGVGQEFTVVFEDGREVKAESLGLDSEVDAALARIVEPGKYPFVEIARDHPAQLGDWVFALGHSGGFDLKRGVVFRPGRIVRTTDTTLQSDCSLIGGDSGGPLFDLMGRLIGIHSRVGAKLPENMHVPVSAFLRDWQGLMDAQFIGDGPFAERPEVGKAFLGLLVEARSEGGVVVKRVGRESPAEKAGLKEGDILLSVDGKPLNDRDGLQEWLASKAPSDQVAFELLRDGESETLTLRLGDRDA